MSKLQNLKTQETELRSIPEGFIQLQIPIRLPSKAYEKLMQYGYDFQMNFEDYARRTYFELLYCEEIEDGKKKAKTERQTKKKTKS